MGLPFTAWRLLPSFKPAQVELVEKVDHYTDRVFYKDGKGKYFAESELFDSKNAAVTAGWSRLFEQNTHIEKLRAGVEKKAEQLTKAAPELKP